jgi:hypothetical protein
VAAPGPQDLLWQAIETGTASSVPRQAVAFWSDDPSRDQRVTAVLHVDGYPAAVMADAVRTAPMRT